MDVSLSPIVDPVSSIAEHRHKIVTQMETTQQFAKQSVMLSQQRMKVHYDASSKIP